MLDTVREVHTWSGNWPTPAAAGPVPRSLAWAIDPRSGWPCCRCAPRSSGAAGAAWAVPGDAVPGVLGLPDRVRGLFSGQTPGKRVLDLRVVSSDGAPVGWLAACVRNLMRTVDMLPFGYACGLVSSPGRSLGAAPRRHRRRHLSGACAARVQAQPLVPTADVAAPRVALRPAEQAAVVAFAERAPRLTPERQAELRRHRRTADRARGADGVVALAGHRQLAAGQALRPMRQEHFIARHQAEWQAFDAWLDARGGRPRRARADRDWRGMDDSAVPAAYRRLTQQLGLARRRGYSPQLVERLQALVQRGTT